MSEQLPQHPTRKTHATLTTHETRRGERGFITPGMALGIGKTALALVLVGTPIVAGLSYGARSTAPDLMTGQIAVTDPAKVEVLETKIEQELCIANSTLKVTAGMGFEGHPLGNDLEGKLFNLVDYNLNLEREHNAEVYRKVRYCLKGMTIPYSHDPSVAFGDPSRPAISAELSLSDLVVVVSALHDGRDKYNETSDGVLGYYASELNKYLEQKTVQNLVGKEIAQNADPQAKIDTILRGALEGYIDREAAVRCLEASDAYDWDHSPIGQLLINAAKEAIQADYLSRDRNRPQPSTDDITVKIINGLSTDPNADIINQAKNADKETALSLLTRPTLDSGAARELDIAGIKVPIEYVINQPTSTPGTCVITPDNKAMSLSAAEKGDE